MFWRREDVHVELNKTGGFKYSDSTQLVVMEWSRRISNGVVYAAIAYGKVANTSKELSSKKIVRLLFD